MDPIDGEYTDKRRFLIFDYCGNFEYFREHIEGFVSKETKSLSENILENKSGSFLCRRKLAMRKVLMKSGGRN